MALIATVTGTPAGALCTPGAAGASNTVNGNAIAAGATVVISVAATPTDVTIVDPGRTPAGSEAADPTPVTVAANTSRAFGNLSAYIDDDNLVTIELSSTTNATIMVLA